MSIKITTEVWLESLPPQNHEMYDYSKVVYTKSKDKVTLICKVCSTEFQQSAGSHASGCGCPACARARSGGTQRLTQEQFIQKSKDVHGERYDYSSVEYKNSTTKVDIVCRRAGHGIFSISSPMHIHQRSGCPFCAQEVRTVKQTKTQEKFLEQCYAQKADKTTFENVEYVSDKGKVSFTCTEHGPFEMSPTNFLQGQRCPSCSRSGYRHALPGTFYVLSDGATTKVGITNRSPQQRANAVFKAGGPQMDIIADLHFRDGRIPRKIENECIGYLKARYERVTQTFDGYTECFLDVDVPDLLNFITPFATTLELAQASH